MIGALQEGESNTAVLVMVALAVLVGITACVWHFSRSRGLLRQWAEDNRYELEDVSYCWLWRGPYTLRSGESHTVYRVTVRDDNGRRRRGWVRCGGWFFGLLSNKTDVRWDE